MLIPFIPVPLSRLHSATTPSDIDGRLLKGDPFVPPTAEPSWPKWMNAVRNGVLATCVWDTRTLLEVSTHAVEIGYRVGWKGRDGVISVRPGIVHTDFVVVKNGAEDCVFFIFDVDGRTAPFTPVARGDKNAMFEAVRRSVENSQPGDFVFNVTVGPNVTFV